MNKKTAALFVLSCTVLLAAISLAVFAVSAPETK
jgi:hypothetical protein